MAEILQVLIWIIVAGGAVAVVNALPLDATVKKIGMVVILCIAAVVVLKWLIQYVH